MLLLLGHESIVSATAGKRVIYIDDRTHFATWTKTLATPLGESDVKITFTNSQGE